MKTHFDPLSAGWRLDPIASPDEKDFPSIHFPMI
jgi:hypothetical protein